MTVLVLVVAEDGLVHVVVCHVTGSQGASSVNLTRDNVQVKAWGIIQKSEEHLVIWQASLHQTWEYALAYLDLWGQEVAVLALVEAEDCLVHVVVCHVTGSQGASSVRLISQKACIVTGLPTSRSVMEDFNTGFLTSSRVHENC